ncbi:TipAS antibiotic-recognition domain-containing protein [Streptomyces sp. NPDC047072]|uniref:TipAS antibiotic-recognition domain-containing protein n=1 Tax=Streptomyces sp. NPDC047072 TaxID=3154809 RepID=UPI00340859D6
MPLGRRGRQSVGQVAGFAGVTVRALRRRHELLTARIEKLQKMATAVEHAMEARTMGINLTPEEKFEVFGDHDPEQHAEEAERRWGTSEAYRESQRRAASYTKEDWLRIKREGEELTARLAAAMEWGAAPDSAAVMDLAEEHRGWISRNHYACSYEMHRGLAEIYVADARFTATIDAAGPGLAVYLRSAILANAARHPS